MSEKLYTTAEAAKYLGLSVSALKNHIYEVGDLHGHKVGNVLLFTQAELDRFRREKRPRGRPPSSDPVSNQD